MKFILHLKSHSGILPKYHQFWTELVPTSVTATNFSNAVEIPCFKKTLNLNRSVIYMYGGQLFNNKMLVLFLSFCKSQEADWLIYDK